MTFPDVMRDFGKKTIGLHTPEELSREIKKEYDWNSVLVAGNVEESIKRLSEEISDEFKKVDYFLIPDSANIKDKNEGIDSDIIQKFNGIVYDYNSYKVKNGTTRFLGNLPIETMNGFVLTDRFQMTSIENLYSVGSVSTVLSGVAAAIYSGQIAAMDIGRKFDRKTKADPSGRFPFIPRESFWNESWQSKIKKYDD
ncbi:hypothetical protein XA3_08080 [Xylocopilactobacillus apicola]|uniref:FAD dependent oxidoreductase n=1 Tax=Xylocopilactobacillus apicola TaxID=2932184 RepID=A0AAU9DC37_9LACO|nr:hypothetical protein XA3_08080 [Xylocopilactobacillus apicola]